MTAHKNYWRSLSAVRQTVILVALGIAGGCGPRVPGNPTTYPLHGKVTLGGKPLTTGIVRFDPVEIGKGVAVDGKIESDGNYKARAFVGQPGTTPGSYKVSIHPDPHGPSGMPPAPEKYQRTETSGLSYTVEAKDNTYDIELK